MEQKIRRDRNIGLNLSKLRNKANISQENLCKILQLRGYDVGRSTYAKYECGQLNVPVKLLLELQKLYNCDFKDFFEGLDD